MRSLYAAVGVLFVAVPVVRAQTTAECTSGVTSFVSYGIEQKLNVPYRATIKTTFEQKLPDGNSIQAYARVHQARDAMGRTRWEIALGCEREEDGQLHPRLSVNLDDPVAKTHSYWQVNEGMAKVVHVVHRDDMRPQSRTLDAAQLEKQRRIYELREPKNESQTEDLGEKTIAGISAHGSRTLRTIPAGEEGNSLPLVVLNETWRSSDLMLTLLGITDDPRRGRTTVEVEDLTQGEPEASLFELPTGYKIEDVHPNPPTQATP